jgi:WD40 repeat protein
MRLSLKSMLLPALLVAQLAVAAFGQETDDKALKPIAPEDPKLGRPVDFERDVYPILDSKCLACHNLAISENGLNLEDVKGIMKGGKRGPSVVAREPEKSLLFKVAARAAQPAMPPLPNKVEAAALTPKEVGILRQWILEGAAAGMGSGGATVNWQPIPKGVHPIYAVALTPDGQFAACGRANKIAIYHIPTGEQIAELTDAALLNIQYNGKPMYEPGASHRDFVQALGFSPDGNMLASGSYREVKLWARGANVTRWNVSASTGPVPALAVSADDKLVAVASADNTIKLFNLADGQPGKVLSGHTATVTGLKFSNDGAKLYSSSHDKSVRAWTVADGMPAGQFDLPAAVHSITLSLDGAKVIAGCADNKILVFAPPAADAQLAVEREITGHGGPVNSVALIGPQGTQICSGSDDQTVRIFELANGNAVRSMNHGGAVQSVSVSPDGQRIVSAGTTNVARLWNAANGQQIVEMKGHVQAQRLAQKLEADNADAKALVTSLMNAIPANEKTVNERTEAQKKAAEAKAAKEKPVAELTEKVKAAQEAYDAAKKAFDDKKDDKALEKAAADAQKALTDQQAALKKAEEDLQTTVKALADADRNLKDATDDLNKTKADHQAATQKQQQAEAAATAAKAAEAEKEKPLRAISFSRDGREIAVAGDAGFVATFDGTTGAPLALEEGHTGPVTALAYAGARTLVTGAADQTVRAWDLNPAWSLVGVLGPKKEAPQDLNDSVFVSRVLCVAFSPDGTLLAAGGGDPSRSGELMIWDVASRTLIRNLDNAHSDTVFGVEFSHDGQYLVSGAADKFVKIHQVADGKFVKAFEGHTNHVLGVTWRYNDKQIASAGADNAIKVWNVETGEQQRTVGGYSKQVTSIRYIGRGANFVSCGGDKTVRFHTADNGNNFRNFPGGIDYMYAAAASDDEKIVVAGGQDGVLRVWNGANAQPIRQFDPPRPAEAQQAAK